MPSDKEPLEARLAHAEAHLEELHQEATSLRKDLSIEKRRTTQLTNRVWTLERLVKEAHNRIDRLASRLNADTVEPAGTVGLPYIGGHEDG